MTNPTYHVQIFPKSNPECVTRRLFGLFFENLGRVVYDGIYPSEGSKVETLENGMRKDVLDAFKKLRIGVVRLPGGDYTDNYHWMNGIGDPDKRPKHYNGNWWTNDPNRFGTHEFIEFCEYLDAEPHFVCNVGTGSVEEARAWVEYCNHESGTELSDLRIKNGRKEPFNVKLWAVGNEAFYRGGLMRPEYYADQYRNYAYFLRLMDPSIELVVPCNMTDPAWNARMLGVACEERRPPRPEHISLHAYWPGGLSKEYTDEGYYMVLSGMNEIYQQLSQAEGVCKNYSTKDHKIRMSIDEWAPWCVEARDPHLFQQSTMREAIVAVRMLQHVAKMGDAVSMLCVSEGINALMSLIMTDGDDMCVTPSYYAYQFMGEHIGGKLLDVVETKALEKVGPNQDVEFVTGMATREGNKIALSFANASLTDDVEMSVDIIGKIKDVSLNVLETNDVRDENTPGQPECVSPKTADAKVEGNTVKFTLAKHSVCSVVVMLED